MWVHCMATESDAQRRLQCPLSADGRCRVCTVYPAASKMSVVSQLKAEKETVSFVGRGAGERCAGRGRGRSPYSRALALRGVSDLDATRNKLSLS